MDQDPRKSWVGWSPELRWKDYPQTEVAALFFSKGRKEERKVVEY